MKKILMLLLLAPVFSKAQSIISKSGSKIDEIPNSLCYSANLSAHNKALVVVDGVIRKNNEQLNYASTPGFGNYPYTVGPDQLGSLTVLNSEKAMALYGSKGKNGAIVITTKKQAK